MGEGFLHADQVVKEKQATAGSWWKSFDESTAIASSVAHGR